MAGEPEGVKVLDVRTGGIGLRGRAPMATNVPFPFLAYVWDDEKQGISWSLNLDIVQLVKERFAPDDMILVSCRSVVVRRWRSTRWQRRDSQRSSRETGTLDPGNPED